VQCSLTFFCAILSFWDVVNFVSYLCNAFRTRLIRKFLKSNVFFWWGLGLSHPPSGLRFSNLPGFRLKILALLVNVWIASSPKYLDIAKYNRFSKSPFHYQRLLDTKSIVSQKLRIAQKITPKFVSETAHLFHFCSRMDTIFLFWMDKK